MEFTTISWDVDLYGVATLKLNRPDQLNAFNLTMARELEHFFLNEAKADTIRAVVVTGEGRAFCAGMDLSAEGNVFGLNEQLDPQSAQFWEEYDTAPFHDGIRDTGGRLSLAIHALPKPVIAAINGAAVGIGATMTLAMDIRLASRNAKVGFVFGRLGIVPEACSTWFLPRIVGIQRALAWVYSADILTADEIFEAGLALSIHEPEELVSAAQSLARSFVCDRSSAALGLAKQMLYRNSAAADPLTAHLSESLAMFYSSISDGKEGVTAFREKRTPNFTSRTGSLPNIYPAHEK